MRVRLLVAAVAVVFGTGSTWAQGRGAAPPAGPPPNPSTDPLLRGFEFRSIGPATMMGRVDDIEGSEKDPMIIYLGFATGGLWKSIDGGNHWKSQFDNMPNESVGSIGIAPSDPNVVYVGMGEANNRQSSSIGNGVWGTTDGGEHWTHLGLEDTQAIGRVVVDPTDPKTVYVAAGGHLFGANTERGLFKSTDGGHTWKKSKYIDPDTGFTDVAIDPTNPKIVYAASYQRRRTWWGFNGGGPGSALWKTTDAGNTWTKLEGPGWPKPKDGIYGRIAISVFRAKPSTIYAQVEAGASEVPVRAPQRKEGRRLLVDAAPWWRIRRAAKPRRGGAEAAEAGADAAMRASQSEQQRGVPLRRWRPDLDLRKQSGPAADLLQPDPRGPDQRPEAFCRRQSRPDVAGRRQNMEGLQGLAHRLSRVLDQS